MEWFGVVWYGTYHRWRSVTVCRFAVLGWNVLIIWSSIFQSCTMETADTHIILKQIEYSICVRKKKDYFLWTSLSSSLQDVRVLPWGSQLSPHSCTYTFIVRSCVCGGPLRLCVISFFFFRRAHEKAEQNVFSCITHTQTQIYIPSSLPLNSSKCNNNIPWQLSKTEKVPLL
jgi:hypothetical protein